MCRLACCSAAPSARIAEKADADSSTLREAALESGDVDAETFDRVCDPSSMVGHGVPALSGQPAQAKVLGEFGVTGMMGDIVQIVDGAGLAEHVRSCDSIVFSAGASGVSDLGVGTVIFGPAQFHNEKCRDDVAALLVEAHTPAIRNKSSRRRKARRPSACLSHGKSRASSITDTRMQ